MLQQMIYANFQKIWDVSNILGCCIGSFAKLFENLGCSKNLRCFNKEFLKIFPKKIGCLKMFEMFQQIICDIFRKFGLFKNLEMLQQMIYENLQKKLDVSKI